MSECSPRWSSTYVPRLVLALSLAFLLVTPALALGVRENAHQGARLEGRWKVSGVFTVVRNVTDRNVGDRFQETWRFRPRCRRGTCTVELGRGRRVVLDRTAATYAGKNTFTGAFFCNGKTYPKGTKYVESWTVRVTRTGPGPRGRRATRITGVGATVGRSSRELPCARVVSLEGVEFDGRPLLG
jgi:hypothetical protein